MTTATSSQTVCVVDDDALVRKTIEGILHSAGYTVVPHASGADFLGAVGKTPAPDCVLLDVKMPDMDGLEVLRRLAAGNHSLSVIMISGQGDISTAVEAMRNGAADFVEKPFTPDHLVRAVERAVSIGTAFKNAAPALGILSSRELEVLELLVAGDANKVIAFKLGISQRTVEVHRARIMERLDVKSFAELVRKAIAAGL